MKKGSQSNMPATTTTKPPVAGGNIKRWMICIYDVICIVTLVEIIRNIKMYFIKYAIHRIDRNKVLIIIIYLFKKRKTCTNKIITKL